MSVANDIMTHAVSLLEGASVSRGISSGRYSATTIEEYHAAAAAAGPPYPVAIVPVTVSWAYPESHTTVAVDQRWDTISFDISVFVTPYSLDPMDSNEELAGIAYEIRRTISDPASWISSVSGFVSVDLDRCTVEAIDTDFEGDAQQQIDFIYALRQPVTVTYREDHT